MRKISFALLFFRDSNPIRLMRIAALHANGYAEHLLMDALQTEHDIILSVEQRTTAWRGFVHLFKRRDSFLKRIDRIAYFLLYHALLGRLLKPQHKQLQRPVPDHRPNIVTDNINDVQLIQRMREANPDLIVVSRTDILGKGWFDLAVPMLNVHPGIAPQYRGLESWKWAVINGDIDQIGVTVHRVTPQVDAGEILVQSRLKDLGSLKIEAISARLSELMAASMVTAVTMVRDGIAAESVPANHGRFPANPTLGLMDYVRFLRARQQVRAAQKSKDKR